MFSTLFFGLRETLRKRQLRLNFAQRQGGEPQAVHISTASQANAAFLQRKPLWLDVAKDKAVSRRQTMQYGKAKPTRQRRILVKETLYLLGDARNTRAGGQVFFCIGFSLTGAGIMSA